MSTESTQLEFELPDDWDSMSLPELERRRDDLIRAEVRRCGDWLVAMSRVNRLNPDLMRAIRERQR